MILFVDGILEYRFDNLLVINCQGVGYSIHIGAQAGASLVPGEPVRIFTHMNVKEDTCDLFGFLTLEDLAMFNMLITVSGVGPKAAQALLAALPPDKLTLAILTDDVKALSKAQGVGKKIAARIVLELKDKLASSPHAKTCDPQSTLEDVSSSSSEKQDATDALVSLGYPRPDSARAVLESALAGMNAQDIIKAALRKLTS